MASMASVSQFTFKTFQNSSPNSKLIPTSSHSLVKRINVSITKSTKLKQNFAVRAAGEDERTLFGGLESSLENFVKETANAVKETSEAVMEANSLEGVLEAVANPFEEVLEKVTEGTPLEGVTKAVKEANPLKAVMESIPSDRGSLKRQLVDSFAGTNRGLSASSETRVEIVELIAHLEAINPNPAPTENLRRLSGKWVLAYTTFVGLFPLLSPLSLAKVAELSQTIVSPDFTVENSVKFALPLATISISANAKFEVRSPMRVQVKFEECVIGSPQLTDAILIPDNVEFLGQKIDITLIRGVLTFVQDTTRSVFSKTISSQPPLKLPISYAKAESWLLTTYVDDELRIAKADGGNIFVLVKSGSPLFNSLPQN